jgi:hypothetical protein
MAIMPPPKEPGWTEMFLPLQALEVRNIHIDEPKACKGPGVPLYAADRPIAALSYKTSTFAMPCLAILTPFLKVHSWDSLTGRLDLEVEQDSLTAIKCNALQETILDLLVSKPQWFQTSETKIEDEIRQNFQPILTGTILTIYLHGPNPEKKQMGRVWIWKSNQWQKGASSTSFKKGQQIRISLRLQGICFLPISNGKTRYRLQHQTVCIFYKQES